MTGIIVRLQPARGLGTLRGEDGKHYAFHRNDVRGVWFHQLTEGATVVFEPGKQLSATGVRPVKASG